MFQVKHISELTNETMLTVIYQKGDKVFHHLSNTRNNQF